MKKSLVGSDFILKELAKDEVFDKWFPRLVYNAHIAVTKDYQWPENAHLHCVSDSALELINVSPTEGYSMDWKSFWGLPYSKDGSRLPGWSWAYGGHQFGVWAGQLGDGRALSLHLLENNLGQLWETSL